jgi:hypothetical protein
MPKKIYINKFNVLNRCITLDEYESRAGGTLFLVRDDEIVHIEETKNYHKLLKKLIGAVDFTHFYFTKSKYKVLWNPQDKEEKIVNVQVNTELKYQKYLLEDIPYMTVIGENFNKKFTIREAVEIDGVMYPTIGTRGVIKIRSNPESQQSDRQHTQSQPPEPSSIDRLDPKHIPGLS